ncbi:Mitochondrial metalloendopeptidase OMA1 [Nymphon striatum]|nr:Mitochondrial metalloendopeptidase OMA1 [Nymphon striatum]
MALAALLAVGGCTTIDALTPDASIKPSNAPIIAENVRSGRLARLGASQHPRILSAYGGEYANVKLERMVAGIVGKLVTVSENPNQVYQISILNSPVVNAFALPGGYLYVSRGLLALASDSAELAAVIAHEMGHVTANHGVLRQKKEQEAQLAQRIVSEAISDKAAGRRALARGRIELAQFSRNQELEADAIGIADIGKAGYDPYAAAAFQKHMAAFTKYRMAEGNNDNGLDFLSTHPSTPQRVNLAVGHARKICADEGYVRGNRYSHVNLGITFEFPTGFAIENKPEAVLAARSDGSAIRFDGDDVPASKNLTEYIASGWVEGLDVTTVRADRINGLDAARAKASVGRWDFDIVVLRANGAVYRILTALPAGSTELDDIAAQVRNSFRLLSASEKKNLKPLRIRLVAAKAGDTVASMALKMPEVDNPKALFKALNGLENGDSLINGRRYKIVTQ